MHRPTPRQQFILGYARLGLLRIRPSGVWEILREPGPPGGWRRAERNPRWTEGFRLLDIGWVNCVVNRKDVKVDTKRRTRKYGRRVKLTAAGKDVLERLGG